MTGLENAEIKTLYVLGMEPATFNSIAVGAGAIVVAAAAVAALFLRVRSDRQDREQRGKIAKQQMEMTAGIGAVAASTHEIKVSMDGRMDELLRVTRELAQKEGIVIGRQEKDTEAADKLTSDKETVRTDAIADAETAAKIRAVDEPKIT